MKGFNKWLGQMFKSSGLEDLPLQPASRSEGDARIERSVGTLTNNDVYEQLVGVYTRCGFVARVSLSLLLVCEEALWGDQNIL